MPDNKCSYPNDEIEQEKEYSSESKVNTHCRPEKFYIETHKKVSERNKKTGSRNTRDQEYLTGMLLFLRENMPHDANRIDFRFVMVFFYKCFHRGSKRGCKNALARVIRVLTVFSFMSMIRAISRSLRSS